MEMIVARFSKVSVSYLKPREVVVYSEVIATK
jgi:hypothetical protein